MWGHVDLGQEINTRKWGQVSKCRWFHPLPSPDLPPLLKPKVCTQLGNMLRNKGLQHSGQSIYCLCSCVRPLNSQHLQVGQRKISAWNIWRTDISQFWQSAANDLTQDKAISYEMPFSFCTQVSSSEWVGHLDELYTSFPCRELNFTVPKVSLCSNCQFNCEIL